MPLNDREVFEHFLKDPDATLEIAHLAYAAYASSKYDWARHFEERKDRPPTAEEMSPSAAPAPPRP